MSKTRPLFTVVMPAYGVEKYLAKAVESIESQTFQEWELIIVEDGSPDKTGSLAEKLKEKDARIRVIHHEQNKGLSEARNTGIQHAAGRYIWFMDPDDTVDMDLLQQVADSLEKNRAKLVVFGHLEEYYNEDGSINNRYLQEGKLKVELLGRGFAWLDTGTPDGLMDAANFVATFQNRQGLQVSCIEEIAYKKGFIDKEQLKKLGSRLRKTPYGQYILSLCKEPGEMRKQK